MRKIVAFIAVFLAAELIVSNFCIKTSRYRCPSAALPASFDGMRIVQISDLHGRGLGGRILLAAAREKPDIIAVTGDIADRQEDVEDMLELIGGLCRIAPVYYVTGNHEWAETDIYALIPELTDMGVKVLQNTFDTITIGADSIFIAGIDDPNGRADMKTPGQLAGELDEKAYTVLLSHRPERFEEYAALGFDLTLSGHIHGGIVRLPFAGGMFSPGMTLFPEYDGGCFTAPGGQMMIVSRGFAGAAGIPRLFNRPELDVIVLSCA